MEEVKRLRQERGWSQQRLADEANINKVTLIRIEHGIGNPGVDTLEKLAKALDVEIADFFPKAQSPLPFNEVRGVTATTEAADIEALLRPYEEGLASLEETLNLTTLLGGASMLRDLASRQATRAEEVDDVTGFERLSEARNKADKWAQVAARKLHDQGFDSGLEQLRRQAEEESSSEQESLDR